MNINPSIKSGDLARLGGDQGGGGSNLLAQLGQRVTDALDKAGGAGTAPINSVDNQMVKNYISGISAQPLAGMNHSFIV